MSDYNYIPEKKRLSRDAHRINLTTNGARKLGGGNFKPFTVEEYDEMYQKHLDALKKIRMMHDKHDLDLYETQTRSMTLSGMGYSDAYYGSAMWRTLMYCLMKFDNSDIPYWQDVKTNRYYFPDMVHDFVSMMAYLGIKQTCRSKDVISDSDLYRGRCYAADLGLDGLHEFAAIYQV